MFRRHGRTAIRCPMLLRHKQLGVFEAVTRDISASGIFIGFNSTSDTPASHVQLGDKLEAKLESPDNESETLALKVVRLDKDGVAVTFL